MSLQPNTLYEGDIFDLMRQLPDESVDMVFSDPDYNVGVRYNGKHYTRSFDEYIEWYIALARESMRVLKPDGNAFFLNMPKPNAHLRARYLDDACYEVHEIAWLYHPNVGFSMRRFTTAHRTILHARKTRYNRWYKNQVAQPYRNPTDKRVKRTIQRGGIGRMPYDWLIFHLVRYPNREKSIHPCQIPSALFRMLMFASTREGDLVLVHFGGSGTEVTECQKHGRLWMTAEIDPVYCDLIRKRVALGRVPDEYRWKPKKRTV
jgi:site-specific DNA-methyltransferase (adenine-specific)